MRELQTEDLLKFGLIPEFIGRLPVVATLDDLDEPALVKILTEPKNALVKQYARLFDIEGVKLTFQEDSLHEVAKRAIERTESYGNPQLHLCRPQFVFLGDCYHKV